MVIDPDRATRFTEIIKLYRRKTDAAKTASVSKKTLRKYMAGKKDADFYSVAKLAMNKGVSLDWLATGEGEMMTKDRCSKINRKALMNSIKMAEKGIKKMNRQFTSSQRAEMVTLMYSMFSEEHPTS